MKKLIEKFEDIVNEYTNIAQEVDAYEVAPAIADEVKKLAIEFSKYLRVNDYLPQLLETGDICYIKQKECWRCQFDGIEIPHYDKNGVFDKFIDECYE